MWGTDKRCGRRKLFCCFVHLTFQAITFEDGFLAYSRINFFGMQNSSPRVPWAFGTRLGRPSHPTSCTEHIFSYRLLWCKAVIDGLLPQCHLSKSNNFSLTYIISVGSVLEKPDQCAGCSGHQWLAEWLQWRDLLRRGIDGENAGKRSLEQASFVNFQGIFPIYLSLLFVVLWSDLVYARQMNYLAQYHPKKSCV